MEENRSNNPTPPAPVYGPVIEPGERKPRGRRSYLRLGLSLFIIGLVLAGAGWINGARGISLSINSNGPQLYITDSDTVLLSAVNERNLQPFNKAEIKTSFADIEFIESDSYGLEIDMPEGYPDPEWKLNGDKLTVDSSKDWAGISLFNFNFVSSSVKVYYPRGSAFEEVKLSASSGNIDAEINYTNEIEIRTSSGTIEAILNGCGDIKADASSGNIKLTNEGENAIKAEVETSSGSIKIDGNMWMDLEAEASSGSINVDAQLVGKTDIEASSGSVHVNSSYGTEYGFNLKVGSGSIRVNGERYDDDIKFNDNADNVINVKTSSGSINLDL